MKTIILIISAFLLLTSAAFAQGAKTSFKDLRDGQVYRIKKVGNLTWMKQNLGYDMRDDSICYDDDDEWCGELGMLYTFEGAVKACPVGWRLPTDADWMDLEKALGMTQDQLLVDGYSTPRGTGIAQKLKEGGSSGLDFKISGFATLGGGGPSFGGINDDRPRSYYWTSTSRTVKGQTSAYRRRIEAKNGNIYRFTNPTAGYAVAVRCVQ